MSIIEGVPSSSGFMGRSSGTAAVRSNEGRVECGAAACGPTGKIKVDQDDLDFLSGAEASSRASAGVGVGVGTSGGQ